MDLNEAVKRLKAMSDTKVIESHARFGDMGKNKLGVTTPDTRRLAKEIGKDHRLARELWKTGVHEARVLATMVDDPRNVTEEQMERWVSDIDSWGICDHACGNLFDKTPFAYKKAMEWTKRDREYEKRTGFALIAYLSVHDKKADDKEFLKFLPIIKREAHDDRNFVKKAVNWALREIGKRNIRLNKEVIKTAKEIISMEERSARWIAADAIRELESDAVQKRLRKRQLIKKRLHKRAEDYAYEEISAGFKRGIKWQKIRCKCGGMAKRSAVKYQDYEVRGWTCRKCKKEYIHPEDSLKISNRKIRKRQAAK